MISSSTLLSLLSSSINTQALPKLTPTLSSTTTTNLNKLLQIEAIKLIQISLDKLTSTKCCNYKENLYKNLFISKILNKSKLYYYQSIVNTLRSNLFSKLHFILNENRNFIHFDKTMSFVEDDYINLIIKEAIDNLVNNNIVIDQQNVHLNDVCLLKRKFVVESDHHNEANTKRIKLNDEDFINFNNNVQVTV
jgi:hypothetical protein